MQSLPSQAAQIIITIIPIVGIVLGSIVIFFFLLWDYKQRMLMIEKGIYERRVFDWITASLLSGLLLFCVGLVLSVFFVLKDGVSYGLLGGLIPLAIGLSLLVYYSIRRKNER